MCMLPSFLTILGLPKLFFMLNFLFCLLISTKILSFFLQFLVMILFFVFFFYSYFLFFKKRMYTYRYISFLTNLIENFKFCYSLQMSSLRIFFKNMKQKQISECGGSFFLFFVLFFFYLALTSSYKEIKRTKL